MPRILRALFGRTETALAAAIVMTAVVFSVASPYFLTMPNLVDLIEAYSVTTILAAGVFVVLVSGGIDISFTATARPTVSARLTIECPIFNSTKCGVSKRIGAFCVFNPCPAFTCSPSERASFAASTNRRNSSARSFFRLKCSANEPV